MTKAVAFVLVVGAVGAFVLLRGDGAGKAVRSCLEDAGASVEKARNKIVLPYALALGSGERVQELPALDHASVYGVRRGSGEAILFFARNGEDAESLEETFVTFGASQGVRLPARRAGSVLLVWTVPLPPSESYALDTCIG